MDSRDSTDNRPPRVCGKWRGGWGLGREHEFLGERANGTYTGWGVRGEGRREWVLLFTGNSAAASERQRQPCLRLGMGTAGGGEQRKADEAAWLAVPDDRSQLILYCLAREKIRDFSAASTDRKKNRAAQAFYLFLRWTRVVK